MSKIKLLDCTLRDGGYYNSWDFEIPVIEKYLQAMESISVDYVELGLRSLETNGFKGPCAYTTDNFVKSLKVPKGLNLGVMVNASELLKYPSGIEVALDRLFSPANESPINLVRVACHVYEFERALVAANWLKEKGYIVGFNLMQIADKTNEEIENLAKLANDYSVDVLYFADSLGGLVPADITNIISAIRRYWNGEIGIHTHDNMGYALANSIQALSDGVTWIDATVTGMGRGPGNAKMEYLAVETESYRKKNIDITPLMALIDEYFKPLQYKCGWGTNVYYYLAGKYGIHPTYIQEMVGDSRYDSEDILSVIEYLKVQEGNRFNKDVLKSAQNFYKVEASGTWDPSKEIENRDVLILGTGNGVEKHKDALEEYIRLANPYVIALNTQDLVAADLIDARAACHPSRLMADFKTHLKLPQPLITPYSMLKIEIQKLLEVKTVKNFGVATLENSFAFHENYCYVPKILVVAYALAIATSGKAQGILLAGFDGYKGEDPRNEEMNLLFNQYMSHPESKSIKSITPTKYQIPKASVYQMIGEYVK